MSSTTTKGTYRDRTSDYEESAGSIFGGTVIALAGLFQFFEGLSAVLKDDVYVTTPNYVFQFDLTTWGWVHLVVGVIAVAVGVAILMGQEWAMLVGIIMASLSMLAQFMFIPWQPIWALVIIAIDIAVIWALASRLSRNDY